MLPLSCQGRIHNLKAGLDLVAICCVIDLVPITVEHFKVAVGGFLQEGQQREHIHSVGLCAEMVTLLAVGRGACHTVYFFLIDFAQKPGTSLRKLQHFAGMPSAHYLALMNFERKPQQRVDKLIQLFQYGPLLLHLDAISLHYGCLLRHNHCGLPALILKMGRQLLIGGGQTRKVMGTTKGLGGTTTVGACPANAAVTVSVLWLAPQPPAATDKSQNGLGHQQATSLKGGVLVCSLLHGANGCPQVDAAMWHRAQARVSVLVAHLVLSSGGWQWQLEGKEQTFMADPIEACPLGGVVCCWKAQRNQSDDLTHLESFGHIEGARERDGHEYHAPQAMMREFEIGQNPLDLAPAPPPQMPETPSLQNMLHPGNGNSGDGFENGPNDDIYPDYAVGGAHIQVVFKVYAGKFVEGNKV
ncbi:hypothetical protein BDK51DRAFT_26471, partial [Blyttiomyces helicus]